MNAKSFISRKLKFQSGLPVTAIAVSYFIMIVAIAVSAGFRHEIREGVADITGDIRLECGQDTMPLAPSWYDKILEIKGVESITPAIYKAGIVKGGDDIQGVLVKGIPFPEGETMVAEIPEKLSKALSIGEGGQILTYFIEDKVKVRKFTVSGIYSSPVEADGKLIMYVPLTDMQRLCGWSGNAASTFEVRLDGKIRSERAIRSKAGEVGGAVIMYGDENESLPFAEAAVDLYPQLFDWLNLIDFNVNAILLLMTIVAGFNMISGLLILLFRHISTIGTLKAMGMTDRGISGVFLRVASRTVILGLAAGNAAALAFCLTQGSTHLIKLNPANYFVSFVPVSLNVPFMLASDVISYAVIMLLLLIPAMFISRVDPAETVRVQ